MPPSSSSHQRETRSDTAYERIRELILEGSLQDQERLMESDIAKLLGMSRTPVREALRRLTSEGFVTYAPHRGVTVTLYDDDALSELYLVREEMESMVTGQAARHASLVDVAHLQAVLDDEADALRAGDFDRLIDTNQRFHSLICRAAHNRFLDRLMAVVHDAAAMLRRTTRNNLARTELAHTEHLAIFQAIQRHDYEAAVQAARTHQQTNLRERLRHRDGERAQARAHAGED